jgi:hypothetical protein
MTFLSGRIWLLATTAALFIGGALEACSSNDDKFGDSGPDGTSPTDGAPNDVKIGGDGGNPGDGGNTGDGSTGPCTTTVLTGSCDIVQQNCPSGQECAPVQIDGGFQSQCVPNSTGNIKEGYACTPAQQNPCVAGLECIDNRCAKHCCLNDDSECGTSHPENFTGRCDTTVTLDGTNPAYAVCTYSAGCEPFDLQACSPTQACILQDSNGTAVCDSYASLDGGQAENTACSASNACLDGMGCYGAPDGGGFTCQWNCYVPPGPFDAGITSLGKGKGGCPAAETCTGVNWNGSLPTWLGLCEK